MKQYNVKEAFEILKDYKITSHEESVRRWLRNGTIKGTQPTNRKKGWVIKEKDLFDFIHDRMPENINTTNDAREVLDKEEVRAEMWWQLVRKNIFEDYIEPKRKQIKECCEHKGHSKAFEKEVWEQVSKHKRGFRTARIPFLLDAFLFNGERIKMDEKYELLDEKILFALMEFFRQKKIEKDTF